MAKKTQKAKAKPAPASKKKKTATAVTNSAPGTVRIPPPWEQDDSAPQSGHTASEAAPPLPPAPPVEQAPPPPLPSEIAMSMSAAPVFKDKKVLKKVWDLMKLRREIAKKCDPLIEEEMALRKELTAILFPNAVEGTNTLDLPDGWKIKLVHTVDRKLDEAALDATFAQLHPGWKDVLLRYVPRLNMEAFREAHPDMQRFIQASCLTEKPNAPKFDIIEPTKD